MKNGRIKAPKQGTNVRNANAGFNPALFKIFEYGQTIAPKISHSNGGTHNDFQAGGSLRWIGAPLAEPRYAIDLLSGLALVSALPAEVTGVNVKKVNKTKGANFILADL